MSVPVANPRISYETAYRDDELLVVVKPRGRVTMPGRGHVRDSLVNGVFAEHGSVLARLGARRDYGLLHRLDRATSGLVAFALTPASYDRLREAFATRRVGKTYLTIVKPKPSRPRGTARMRLEAKRRGDLQVSVPNPRGLEAVTHWQTLASGTGGALLACRIETGRLHQIRAHLAALGCPVVGDTVYGGRNPPDTRASVARKADRSLQLHAWQLVLPQGRKKSVTISTAPPAEFREAALAAGIEYASAIRRLRAAADET